MKLLHSLSRLPWKYVIGINAVILTSAITFTAISSIGNTTENRSQAKEIFPSPPAYITVDKNSPPKLFDPEPDWAKIGDAIVIKGENFGNYPFGILYLGDIKVPHENIVAWESDQIVFIVPDQATTSYVTLNYNDDQFLKTSKVLKIVTKNQ